MLQPGPGLLLAYPAGTGADPGVQDLDRELLRSYLARLAGRRLSLAARNCRLAAIRFFTRFLIVEGVCRLTINRLELNSIQV